MGQNYATRLDHIHQKHLLSMGEEDWEGRGIEYGTALPLPVPEKERARAGLKERKEDRLKEKELFPSQERKMKAQLVCIVFILLCAAVQNRYAFKIQTEVQKDVASLTEPLAETSGLQQALLRRAKRHSTHISICTYCCKCCKNKGCGFCCRT